MIISKWEAKALKSLSLPFITNEFFKVGKIDQGGIKFFVLPFKKNLSGMFNAFGQGQFFIFFVGKQHRKGGKEKFRIVPESLRK